MYLSKLIEELQGALDTCGDTDDISAVIGEHEAPVMFIDFEKDNHKNTTKVRIFTGS